MIFESTLSKYYTGAGMESVTCKNKWLPIRSISGAAFLKKIVAKVAEMIYCAPDEDAVIHATRKKNCYKRFSEGDFNSKAENAPVNLKNLKTGNCSIYSMKTQREKNLAVQAWNLKKARN